MTENTGVSEMVQQLKVLPTKPEDVSFILESTWQKERTDSCKLSYDLHTCIMEWLCTYSSHTHTCMLECLHVCTHVQARLLMLMCAHTCRIPIHKQRVNTMNTFIFLSYSLCSLGGWVLCSRPTCRCRLGEKLLFSPCRWLLAGFSSLQTVGLGSQLISGCSSKTSWSSLACVFLHRPAYGGLLYLLKPLWGRVACLRRKVKITGNYATGVTMHSNFHGDGRFRVSPGLACTWEKQCLSGADSDRIILLSEAVGPRIAALTELLLLFFQMGSHANQGVFELTMLVEAGIKLMILPYPPPNCWNLGFAENLKLIKLMKMSL